MRTLDVEIFGSKLVFIFQTIEMQRKFFFINFSSLTINILWQIHMAIAICFFPASIAIIEYMLITDPGYHEFKITKN